MEKHIRDHGLGLGADPDAGDGFMDKRFRAKTAFFIRLTRPVLQIGFRRKPEIFVRGDFLIGFWQGFRDILRVIGAEIF